TTTPTPGFFAAAIHSRQMASPVASTLAGSADSAVGFVATVDPLLTRRRFLHDAAAVTGGAIASSTAMGATTTSTSPATTQAATQAAASIDPADVAALCRLTGHDFTPGEQAMMAGDLAA